MKTVIEMAQQVGYPIQHEEWRKATEEFAALVRADAIAYEREACAKVCDALHYKVDAYGAQCAAAIRARGQA